MRKKRDGKVLFDLEPTHSRTEVKSSSTFESKIVFDKLHEGRVNKEPFKHVDVDELLEDYAWKMFKEAGPKKTSNLDQFKHMEKEHAAFTLNRKHLNLVHDDPIYGNVQKTGPRSSTIFKSVFTNYTSDKELFSSGNTLSKRFCKVSREQGYAFGNEAMLELIVPDVDTELKYEIHFDSRAETNETRSLTWDMHEILVPAGGQIEVRVVIEEMSYSGHYTLVSSLSGMVTVNITRDGVLVLPVTFNVATAFQQYLAKSEPRLKGVVSMDHDKVKLTSKGTYHFQHVLKQRVFHNYLRDGKPAASPKHGPSGVTATAPSSEMNRMNLQGYNKRSTYANVTRYGKK